ncbi:phage terminase large subunit [Leptothoe sp. PORK10 BA2]|uniref:phage terminase large subunit n=1 Tax=Leptothoe sp. PORK10 BA2 TaxID=3110254 RepID=UPI002B1F8FE3|nr:phage terminase large subunit [Leptothoe sp. PORK10 BA2]MEA5465278.1 phage terminase large subunit [Leptothoe sp. PORK10 BA2]
MSLVTEIKPQPGPQTNFLESRADIVIYGGGAGGGKTWSLLLECIRYVANPRFSAVIFRRTSPQITAPGGLLDASMELFPLLGGMLKRSRLEWIFPSGAKVVFRHLKLDRDCFSWQGAEVPLICWDEMCHFTESQFWYLMSRNRSTCGVRPYVRGTCNPDPDSFVAGLIEWFLDEDGYPDLEKAGEVRYFVRENGAIAWVDETYRDAETGLSPKSLTFIPSSIYNNPALLKANPEYLLNLKSLPEVERMQLLGGNWRIKRTAGKFFKGEWFYLCDRIPAGVVRWVRFWDFAASSDQQKGDSDYTASCLMGLLPDNRAVITNVTAARLTPGAAEQALITTAAADGVQVAQRWQRDPGQAGVYQDQRLRSLLRGYDAKGTVSQISKAQRAGPLARAAEFGEILILNGVWNAGLLNELSQFPDGKHDDQVDAAAGAYLELSGEGALKFGTASFR